MTTQEEWRRIAYEREMGRRTGKSGGTIYGAEGAREYREAREAEEKASRDRWSRLLAKRPDFSKEPVYNNARAGADVPSTAVPGISDAIISGLINLSTWFVEHIGPLRAAAQLGKDLDHVGWKFRLSMTIVGACMFPVLIVGVTPVWPWGQATFTVIAGNSAIPIAVAIGAIVGLVLISVVGTTLQLAIYLTGLAIALALIALVLGLVYTGIALYMGWPPLPLGLS